MVHKAERTRILGCTYHHQSSQLPQLPQYISYLMVHLKCIMRPPASELRVVICYPVPNWSSGAEVSETVYTCRFCFDLVI